MGSMAVAAIRESKSDMIIAVGLLAFSGFAAWRTLGIRRGFGSSIAGPSFLPWVMIALLVLLSVALLVRAGLSARKSADAPVIALPDRATALRLAGFVVLLAGYAVAFFPVGYLWSTLAAFVLGLWLIGERKPMMLLGFPVAMTAIIYFLFTKLLSVWLP